MVSNLHLIVLDVLDSNPQNVLSTVQSAIQNESDTELNKKSGTQSMQVDESILYNSYRLSPKVSMHGIMRLRGPEGIIIP